jgi:hypothetical protein
MAKCISTIAVLLSASLSLLCSAPLSAAQITDIDSGEEFNGKFMEAGTVYVTSGLWTSVVSVHTNFSNAKVFVSILQSETMEIYSFPLVPRLRNVGSIGQAMFEISLFYPDGDECQGYVTPSVNGSIAATVAWMVVEAGGYTLDDGKLQLVIDTALVGGSPTRVFWSHRFGTYCSNTGGAEDISTPGGLFTIQTTNTYTGWSGFLVPRVSGWERVGTQCNYGWRIVRQTSIMTVLLIVVTYLMLIVILFFLI